MTETQTIWLVLALIYAAECIRWLRPGQTLARSWRGRRWRFAGPSRLLGNHRGGIVACPPLPPLGTVYVSSPPALLLAPEGFAPTNDPQRTLAWSEQLRFEAEGRTVRVDGRRFFTAPSPGLARHAARTLHQLARLAPAQRPDAIRREFAESFDVAAVRRRLDELTAAARGLRPLANGLFVFVFGIAPLVAWRVGFTNCWWTLLLGAFALAIPAAWRFRRAHLALFPDADDERFNHFLIVLLSPVSAIRAHDLLSRPLLETFHPLAVIRALGDDATFRAAAERTLRDLRYGPEPAHAIGAAPRGTLLAVLEEFLRGERIDPATLLRPPATVEPGCAAYCPRCLAQFTSAGGGCPDCGAPRTVAFGA
jgi:hypothetical protein